MKIGFDFDGVVADCGRLKSDAARELYGLDIPPEKFNKKDVIAGRYLTPDQYSEFQRIIYTTREIGLCMQPVAGMLESIPQLLAVGHTLRIVTSRDGEGLSIAQEWSRQRGIVLDFVGVGRGVSKAAACQGLDIFVDDDLEKLRPLINVVPHRFLFSWGYNAHTDVGNDAKRVWSWDELLHTIKTL
jgi:hypothetical protein